jgi:hypothetical protein
MVLKKEDLISILKFWNFWKNEPKNIKSRSFYEKQIENLRKTKEVIVLKGIRRCGKSTLLNLEIKNLLTKVSPENILFINFEEPKFSQDLSLDFLDYIYETYLEYLEPKGKIYLFLDEIQNIPSWEKWVLRMYEKTDMQIYVTGSSSKLLSSEFSTALSGRHLSIEVYPLSFKEYLSFKGINLSKKADLVFNKIKIKHEFQNFLIWGGFPKVLAQESDLNKKNELIAYYETIILKDISKRYNISNLSDLKNLSFYLMSNIAKFYSVNNLKNLNLGAYDTIKKYLDYLKETYLIFDLDLFDYSVKKQLVNPKKIYSIDTGFINAISFKFSEDIGRILENLVFIELKRRGKEIYYHKEKFECDFLVKEGLDIDQVIQVTKSLNDEEAKKREFKGLLEAIKKYNLKEGLILTEDEEGVEIVDELKVKIIPIWKWLLIEN